MLGGQIRDRTRSGNDDGLCLRGIEGTDLSLVSCEPWRVLVAKAEVQRQAFADTNIILDKELLVGLLPAEVIGRISARYCGWIAEQEIRVRVTRLGSTRGSTDSGLGSVEAELTSVGLTIEAEPLVV